MTKIIFIGILLLGSCGQPAQHVHQTQSVTINADRGIVIGKFWRLFYRYKQDGVTIDKDFVLLESQIISPANSVSGILTTRTAKVIPTPKFAANVESILSINRIKLADIFSARNMYIAEPKGDLLKALNNLYVNEGTEIKIK